MNSVIVNNNEVRTVGSILDAKFLERIGGLLGRSWRAPVVNCQVKTTPILSLFHEPESFLVVKGYNYVFVGTVAIGDVGGDLPHRIKTDIFSSVAESYGMAADSCTVSES